MSRIKSLLNSVDIDCPYCGEPRELEDVDISVCVEGRDICRPQNEGSFEITCKSCGKTITVTAQIDIGVKIVKEVSAP